MESAPYQGMNKPRIIVMTTCVGVEEKEELLRTEKEIVDGKEKIMETRRSLGWFALFDGSGEWLHVGDSPPPFAKGDAIKITLEKW